MEHIKQTVPRADLICYAVSIRSFARLFLEAQSRALYPYQQRRCHCWNPRHLPKDGFEMTFGVGHFLLVNLFD